MLLLYNLALWFYFAGIRIAAVFNVKARKWVVGRKNIFSRLEHDFQQSQIKDRKIIWMHCASLGEFEQGRTVLESLKKERPDVKILLTFFSPSGFEARKNYPLADWIYYLPADTASNARRFLQIVQPALAIFVKYEFWYHYLTHLKKQKTPVLLLAAVFRPEQIFFKWHGSLHRKMLGCFSKILVQNPESASLLSKIHIENVTVIGDTRVDRVWEIANLNQQIPTVKKFCGNSPTLICGSTWQKDEQLIIPLINSQEFASWKFIIAPHEVRAVHLLEIENQISLPALRFNQAQRAGDGVLGLARVLIIDHVGTLAAIYKYGRVAYIGGGFGKGIHNILEPVAFGLPVIFGSNFGKFIEAKILVEKGGAIPVTSFGELKRNLKRLEGPEIYMNASMQARFYILSNKGATSKATREAVSFL